MKHQPLPQVIGCGRTQTEKQAAAAKRNFACFALKGMSGNMIHVRQHVPPALADQLQDALAACLAHIHSHPKE